jgi:hypothetical protein
MKLLDIQAAIGTAILLLCLPCDAKHTHQLTHLGGKRHDHRHLHKTIQASPRAEGTENELGTRSGQCAFPGGDGMVAVTPGSQNAGWAMSPDQPCTPGMYCPYACEPGMVSMQWDPAATSYTYPLNMVCCLTFSGTSMADNSSTAGSTATTVAWCPNPSPGNLIVLKELTLSVRKIHVANQLRSVRRFCLVMRLC